MNVHDALKKLARAARRLSAEQGERARRNARLAVSAAVRTLRAAVDEQFPAPPRKSRVVRTRDAGVIDKRMERRGYVKVWDLPGVNGERHDAVVAILAAAGITVKKAAGKLWAPAWTMEIAQAEWPKAARDVKYRRALLAEAALNDLAAESKLSMVRQRKRRAPYYLGART